MDHLLFLNFILVFFGKYQQGSSKNWKFDVDRYKANDHLPIVNDYILGMVQVYKDFYYCIALNGQMQVFTLFF
jgi:hypothetical protein